MRKVWENFIFFSWKEQNVNKSLRNVDRLRIAEKRQQKREGDTTMPKYDRGGSQDYLCNDIKDSVEAKSLDNLIC